MSVVNAQLNEMNCLFKVSVCLNEGQEKLPTMLTKNRSQNFCDDKEILKRK